MFYLGIETVIWCSLKTFAETETTQKGIVLPFFLHYLPLREVLSYY